MYICIHDTCLKVSNIYVYGIHTVTYMYTYHVHSSNLLKYPWILWLTLEVHSCQFLQKPSHDNVYCLAQDSWQRLRNHEVCISVDTSNYSTSWNFNIERNFVNIGCELVISCSNQRNQTIQFWWMPAPSASHSNSPSAVLGKSAVIATPDHPVGYKEELVHPDKALTEEVGRICAGITQ